MFSTVIGQVRMFDFDKVTVRAWAPIPGDAIFFDRSHSRAFGDMAFDVLLGYQATEVEADSCLLLAVCVLTMELDVSCCFWSWHDLGLKVSTLKNLIITAIKLD